jgi:hypothetical protein
MAMMFCGKNIVFSFLVKLQIVEIRKFIANWTKGFYGKNIQKLSDFEESFFEVSIFRENSLVQQN